MAEQINQLGAMLGLLQQGFTPEQARAQIDEARAMQFAQLSPSQQRTMMGFQAGQGLGRGLQGLFGVQQEDPMVKMATQMRGLETQFDTTTSEGMMQYAQALRQVNPQMAQQAALAARKMEQEEARVGLTRAQTSEVTSRAGRETRLAEEAAAKATKEQEAMKGRAAALRKRFPEMTEEESETLAADPAVVRELIKPVKVDGKTVKTKTVTAGGRVLLINEETGETIKDIGAAGKTLGQELGAGLGILGTNLAEALKKESGKQGEFSATMFNDLGKSVAAGISSKRNIATLNDALKVAFTGSLADTKTSITKFFDAVGAPVPEELKKAASNTELIGAMGTRYVFPLVKNFPGSLAAKELDRLEKTAPNSLQQPETIRRLMDLLKVDLAETEFTYNKAKAYKENNKGSTLGFNEADARIEFQNKLTSLRSKVNAVKARKSMTAAEKAEIEALKKELGVE